MSDSVAAAPTAHELLLALAGWVDDDLLATGRELVAVGEEARALELLVASLAAERAGLPEPVRADLVDAAVALRVEPHADRALPPGVPPGETAHRFTAGAGPADVAERIAGIAADLPVVARSGARVSLVWRLTPSGAAPGPLPHPVLLAAVQGDGPVEVLAYQLGAALARAGVPASVEAFVEGTTLPPYHLAARSEAVALDPGAGPEEAAPAPGAVDPDDDHDSGDSDDPPGPASVSDRGGSPPGPWPGAGPFDDDPAPDHGTPALHPVAPPRPDGGAGPMSAHDVPHPGADTERPMDGHPAPRPAPRRVAPVPWSPGPRDDEGTGPEQAADIDPGPAEDAVSTPVNGLPPADPVTSTMPLALARPEDALEGPLDRPLLDSRLDRAEGTPGPDDRGYDRAGAGGDPADPATSGAYPGEETWDRDWATGAWSTAGPDVEPDTGPAPADGATGTPRPRLRSVSGPPPILHAPAPGRPRPGPSPSWPATAGPGPARPGPRTPEEASGPPSATPEDLGPSRPRHRLDVPDTSEPAGATGAPPDEEPDGGPDPTDPPTEQHRAVGTGAAGEDEVTSEPVDASAHPQTPPDVAADRPAEPGADTAALPTAPVPSTGNRDTDARAQHPAAQDPPDRRPRDPAGNGRRPTPRPSRGDPGSVRGADLGGRLTPNEQQLLRRLQEELAARENGSSEHGPRNGTAHPDSG